MKLIIWSLCLFIGLIHAGINKNIIGEWEYNAPSAPAGYQAGEIHISSPDQETYNVKIVIGEYTIPAKDIKVDENTISFMITVEGTYVNLKLSFEEGKLKGSASTPDGIIMIDGERKKKE